MFFFKWVMWPKTSKYVKDAPFNSETGQILSSAPNKKTLPGDNFLKQVKWIFLTRFAFLGQIICWVPRIRKLFRVSITSLFFSYCRRHHRRRVLCVCPPHHRIAPATMTRVPRHGAVLIASSHIRITFFHYYSYYYTVLRSISLLPHIKWHPNFLICMLHI